MTYQWNATATGAQMEHNGYTATVEDTGRMIRTPHSNLPIFAVIITGKGKEIHAPYASILHLEDGKKFVEAIIGNLDEEPLRPCPFCGEPGVIDRVTYPIGVHQYYPHCTNPHCLMANIEPDGMGRVMKHYPTPADATTAWNTRYDDEF